MNCGNCGSINPKESDFCSNCGTKFVPVYETQTQNDPMATPHDETAPQQYERHERLYRSREDRWVGGVVGGIGERYGVDPNILRLVWFLLIFAWGSGLIAYIIAWIIVPENPQIFPRNAGRVYANQRSY